MSRILMIVVSLLYIVGGFAAGIYAQTNFLQDYQGIGANLLQSDTLMLITALVLVAAALHFSQVFRARSVESKHCNNENELGEQLQRAKSECAALKESVEENQSVLMFCRDAIGDAMLKEIDNPIPELTEAVPPPVEPSPDLVYSGDDAVEQPKDYAEALKVKKS